MSSNCPPYRPLEQNQPRQDPFRAVGCCWTERQFLAAFVLLDIGFGCAFGVYMIIYFAQHWNGTPPGVQHVEEWELISWPLLFVMQIICVACALRGLKTMNSRLPLFYTSFQIIRLVVFIANVILLNYLPNKPDAPSTKTFDPTSLVLHVVSIVYAAWAFLGAIWVYSSVRMNREDSGAVPL